MSASPASGAPYTCRHRPQLASSLLLPRLADLDDSAHSMMAHATELETEDGIGAWSIERDSETVHVTRHGLGLGDQMTIRCVQAEAMVHVQGRDAELHRHTGGHRDRPRDIGIPGLQSGAGPIG